MRWYRKAAEQGDADAQNNLGLMYENGLGVLQNYAEAVRWFRKAADRGHIYVWFNLGRMYAEGLGVPQDYVQAHMWFNLIALRSSGEDHDDAVKARNFVEGHMTPVEIGEAEKLAREWLEKHQKTE